MTDTITIVGTAGTSPQTKVTPTGRSVTSFRLASNIRRRDPETGTWVDAGTNWYTVSAWASLGEHVATSISQGEPVIVVGRLRVESWGEGERRGTSVDIVADSIGHSLQFGTSSYTRTARRPQADDAAGGERTGHGTPVTGDEAASAGVLDAGAGSSVGADGWAVVGAGAAAEPGGESGASDETPF